MYNCDNSKKGPFSNVSEKLDMVTSLAAKIFGANLPPGAIQLCVEMLSHILSSEIDSPKHPSIAEVNPKVPFGITVTGLRAAVVPAGTGWGA